MGGDPVEVCRWFASRDPHQPCAFPQREGTKGLYERYTEVFIDEGEIDMVRGDEELLKPKYTG